jgi:hypothetical protein
MKRIYSKNHYVLVPFSDLAKLMKYLHSNKSIFVVSMNRVMPCKFFTNRAWLKSKRFADMFTNEEFIPVMSKEQFVRERMRIAIKVHNDWVYNQIRFKKKKTKRFGYI